MSEFNNVFLSAGTALPPRTSRLAAASAMIGVATLFVMLGSSLLFAAGFQRAAFYLAFAQLIFPAAIVTGHLAARQLERNPDRYKGRALALMGTYIGYFNLILAAMVVYFIFARTGV